jgi:acyl-CoA thioesterase FadM
MSGLWRNLLILLIAVFKRDVAILQTGCTCTFWVTPFDVGIRNLKSDKYLQLAESAQLDFGVRSGLLARMRRVHCAMVNVEQLVQFTKPIKLFDKVCVNTIIVFADAKFVHFQHAYFVRGQQCASVAVKAKFKSGRITQSASELTGLTFTTRPHAAL